MKKVVLMILSVFLVALHLTACSELGSVQNTVCEHEYSSLVTREPTYDAEGEITYTCSKCDSTYTESIEKLERHIVPATVLDSAVSNAKYSSGPFSITLGKLVNSAMSNYSMKHYTGDEALSKGYLNKSQIDSSVDINNLYCSIISGDTKVNPSIPYMTEYEDVAVKVWMIFDENDNLQNYGVELCSNLQTCAILIMSSSY